jgi:hypothetical protein
LLRRCGKSKSVSGIAGVEGDLQTVGTNKLKGYGKQGNTRVDRKV